MPVALALVEYEHSKRTRAQIVFLPPGERPGVDASFERTSARESILGMALRLCSSPVLHDPGVGDEVPLEKRVRLGEITNSGRAVTDRGSRLDDRFEDRLTGLLTETLTGHGLTLPPPLPLGATSTVDVSS